MDLVVFEDDLSVDLAPLTLTRPAGDLLLGTRTLVKDWTHRVEADHLVLVVRSYLREAAAANHPTSKVNPESVDDESLFVHAQLLPRAWAVGRLLGKPPPFVGTWQGRVLAAKLPERASSSLLQCLPDGDIARLLKRVPTFELPESAVARYPWQLVSLNGQALRAQTADTAGERQFSSTEMSLRGDLMALKVSPGASLERPVFFDTRRGDVVVEKGAEIQAFSRIEGPAYIGENTVIRSALIRGSTIGPHCRIGGELEDSVIAAYSNKAHSSFLGHAYVGSWVNIGALSTNSDLKNTYGEVRVSTPNGTKPTGFQKVGCFIGDNAKCSVGTIVYSGVRVGVASHLHGTVTEDVPSFTIHAQSLGVRSTELELTSAIRTQHRMMARRGVKQSELDRAVLRSVFEVTKPERLAARVLKGHFRLSHRG